MKHGGLPTIEYVTTASESETKVIHVSDTGIASGTGIVIKEEKDAQPRSRDNQR